MVCIPELRYSSVTPGRYRSFLIRVCCLFSALRQKLKKNVLLGSNLLAAPFPICTAFGKAQLRSRLSAYLSSIIFFTSSCTLNVHAHTCPWLSLLLSVCQDISWSHQPSVATHVYHERIIRLLKIIPLLLSSFSGKQAFHLLYMATGTYSPSWVPAFTVPCTCVHQSYVYQSLTHGSKWIFAF